MTIQPGNRDDTRGAAGKQMVSAAKHYLACLTQMSSCPSVDNAGWCIHESGYRTEG